MTVRITEKNLPQKQGGDQMKTSRLQRQGQMFKLRVKTARWMDIQCINSYILNCIPKTKANVCQKVSVCFYINTHFLNRCLKLFHVFVCVYAGMYDIIRKPEKNVWEWAPSFQHEKLNRVNKLIIIYGSKHLFLLSQLVSLKIFFNVNLKKSYSSSNCIKHQVIIKICRTNFWIRIRQIWFKHYKKKKIKPQEKDTSWF